VAEKKKKTPHQRGLDSDSQYSSLIDFVIASGPNAQDHHDFSTLDTVDDAHIASPYPAASSQYTPEGFTELVGFTFSNALTHHLQDSPRLSSAELLEVVLYSGVKSNAPAHKSAT